MTSFFKGTDVQMLIKKVVTFHQPKLTGRSRGFTYNDNGIKETQQLTDKSIRKGKQ